jgi:hypothetical protein
LTIHLDSLAALGVRLGAAAAGFDRALTRFGLEPLGQLLENRMRAKIGDYQGAAGPFPAWAPLADSTEDRKAAMGYPADSPLLATGEMLASFRHDVAPMELVVGATDEKMVFHEFGTENMPPRPVVGPVAFESQDDIRDMVGGAAVAGIVGADGLRRLGASEIHESLGYNFTIRTD